VENDQLSVLVIDQDARSLNFLSTLLVKQGHSVQAASQGKEGYISALRDHPANVAWQARMAELLEVEDDYSGNDSGIRPVWQLPAHGPDRKL
jgi:CheY-like chemotaxis protein